MHTVTMGKQGFNTCCCRQPALTNWWCQGSALGSAVAAHCTSMTGWLMASCSVCCCRGPAPSLRKLLPRFDVRVVAVPHTRPSGQPFIHARCCVNSQFAMPQTCGLAAHLTPVYNIVGTPFWSTAQQPDQQPFSSGPPAADTSHVVHFCIPHSANAYVRPARGHTAAHCQ